ncbi:cytochrome P450 52A12 [Diutina catenulata]
MANHPVFVYVIALVVCYIVANYIQTQRLNRKFGAKQILHKVTDGVKGFYIWYPLTQKKKTGESVDYGCNLFFKKDGTNMTTFEQAVMGSKIVVTKDPENIKSVLATKFNDFDLGNRHSFMLPLLGDGIFTLDGAGWKHSRAMLRPQFAREQVAHVRALEPHVQVLAKHVRNAHGQPFDIQELFFRLTVDSATEFLFGESVESLRDESVGYSTESMDAIPGKREFAEAFNTSQNYLSNRALLQNFYFLINNKEFRECNRLVHLLTDYYVKKTLAMSPAELEKHSTDGYTFLYELAKQTRDPRVLRDQALNILLAGRDTTAGLLSFTFLELARNKQIFNRLREEIEQNFGLGDESRIEEITFESLKKCEYLKAVINEALRLYPSVPRNLRYANKHTTIPRGGGPKGEDPVLIRKGEVVIYSVYAMHRETEFYGKDAHEFRPERWYEPETRKLGWAFLPFNGGPRICLGQQFALTEASYVVVRLLQLFESMESLNVEYPPKKAAHLTMSVHGTNMIKVQ